MMGEGMTQRKQGIKDMECGTGPCPYHPFHLLTLALSLPRNLTTYNINKKNIFYCLVLSYLMGGNRKLFY